MRRGPDSLDREAPRVSALPLFRAPRSPASPPLSEGDHARLGRQYRAVRDFMLRCGWVTLRQIEEATGAPQASASARIRDLRAHGHRVERRREGGGFAYRVAPR